MAQWVKDPAFVTAVAQAGEAKKKKKSVFCCWPEGHIYIS